jgi:uncharacterized membrane protein
VYFLDILLNIKGINILISPPLKYIISDMLCLMKVTIHSNLTSSHTSNESPTSFSPLVILHLPPPVPEHIQSVFPSPSPASFSTPTTPPINAPSATTHYSCVQKPSLTPTVTSSIHPMQTRFKVKNVISIHKSLLATKHPIEHIILDPTTYNQSSKHQHWRDVMTIGLDALVLNITWSLVPIYDATNVMGCKWVYKIKKRENGSIERFKAKLIAKKYTQEEGLDFSETFSSVIKSTSIKIILCLAVNQHYPIRQVDVNNTFLHGDLHEIIHMEQPPNFLDTQHPTHVCRLHKALYDLCQSSRACYHKL